MASGPIFSSSKASWLLLVCYSNTRDPEIVGISNLFCGMTIAMNISNVILHVSVFLPLPEACLSSFILAVL